MIVSQDLATLAPRLIDEGSFVHIEVDMRPALHHDELAFWVQQGHNLGVPLPELFRDHEDCSLFDWGQLD